MPIDAETILKRATPLVHQHAHELQPFDHLVRIRRKAFRVARRCNGYFAKQPGTSTKAYGAIRGK